MSECRVGSAKMLAGASVAIVVIAGSGKDRRMDRGLFHCYVQHAQHGPRPGAWKLLDPGTFKTGTWWKNNGRISKRYFRFIQRNIVWRRSYRSVYRQCIRKAVSYLKFQDIRYILKCMVNMKIYEVKERTELLFLSPKERGKGLGRQLAFMSIWALKHTKGQIWMRKEIPIPFCIWREMMKGYRRQSNDWVGKGSKMAICMMQITIRRS